MNPQEVADEIRNRLIRLFLPDADGRRPCFGDTQKFDKTGPGRTR